ncbi:hypothetical protein L1987_77961 [Smallanthus sonchifolius]|uniref:Uncharacterized protein n=1 Tax=Smallanthus sonchifolius TaxID=185202 RepID=A0ACB8ZFT8_9ASTR|nr:hypothetical protein L1987_77961 [Smallanthus sonchifolius]
MALDNETKTPVVEAEEKTTTKVPEVEVVEDVEKIKTEKEPQVEQKVVLPMDDVNNINKTKEDMAEAVAEIIEKKVDELVVAKEAVPDVAETKQDEPKVIDEPIGNEKLPIPADEIAMKNEAENIEKQEKDEPLKTEEPAMDVKKDDEATKDDKTVEAFEIKDNGGYETAKENADPEKPGLDLVKTESKEEKTVDEAKLTDSDSKGEKTSPRQSISLMGKVKKSFMKAKKAITGKNTTSTSTSTSTNTSTKTPETKEEEKA